MLLLKLPVLMHSCAKLLSPIVATMEAVATPLFPPFPPSFFLLSPPPPLPSLPPPPPPPPTPHSHTPTDLHRFCDCLGQPVQTDRDLRQCHNGRISWSQLLRALSTHVSAFCSDLQPYKSVRVSYFCLLRQIHT